MNHNPAPLPVPTRCPNPDCGHMDRTTVCRYCGTDKAPVRKTTDQEVVFQKFLDGLQIKRKEKA